MACLWTREGEGAHRRHREKREGGREMEIESVTSES